MLTGTVRVDGDLAAFTAAALFGFGFVQSPSDRHALLRAAADSRRGRPAAAPAFSDCALVIA